MGSPFFEQALAQLARGEPLTDRSICLYFRSCRRAAFRDGHPALTATPDGFANANHFGVAGEWQRIEIVVLGKTDDASGHSCLKVALKSCHGKYLRADVDTNAVDFGAVEQLGWEEFELAEHGDGTF
ncbi:hypothetical protein KFE25_006210 [Diacronema lutheri]|uniref:Uncharacterized protein n=1 Tax=Diacronema lutheri TaxID=2081491 RepID=A0A8J5XXJ0_DIALT|nr:hypothetical protein KFE25_006210 [Diacronema lutheri]